MLTNPNRRKLIQAGGVVLLAAALPVQAQAAPSTEAEKANVKLVKAFVKAWTGKYDPDKVMNQYLAANAVVRMEEDKPALIGPNAVAAASKQWMASGATVDVKVVSTFAKGPIVVTTRVDTVKMPGKPDQPMKLVGVFKVKDGKIVEWTDYIDS